MTIAVDAVDAAGNASAQSTVTATPGPCGGGSPPVAPAPPGDTTPPSTPTGVSVSGVSQTAVTLSWSASSDDVGVAGYRLYQDGSGVGTVTGTNFTFTGLSCATTYAVGVAAFDAAGNVSGTVLSDVATQACAGDSTPPSTPAGLAISAVDETSATLSWSPASDDTGVTGYRLFQGGSQVGTSTTTSFGYTGLTCATTYTLGVAAVDAAGNVSGTAIKSLTTAACPDTTPPSTPTGLATSAIGQTSVALSWNASTDDVGVTGYRVFRDGSQVGTPSATSFSFTGLTCGTTYTLGVAAVDAAGNVSGIATSNVATAACPDTTPPSTPTGLATSAIAATSANLSWTASTDNIAVTGYRLFRDGSQVGTSATTNFSFTGLTCETTYMLGVAAVDAAGNVSGTASESVPTAACPDTTPPSTPTGLATSAIGQTSATLSWTASTDNVAVTGYRLFQGGSQVGTSATTSFGYTGLTCGTTYTLAVVAVDAAGNVSGTATKSVTTTACADTTPPSTPTGLATSAVAATSATLSWTASTDNVAVTGYRLFQGGSQVGTSATTSFGYTGLTCATTYTLGVAAVDAAGNVSGTATKSLTTAACPDTTPPSTPTGLATSAIGQTSVALSWTASTDNVGVTGYRVFRDGSQVGTPTAATFSFTGAHLRHDLHARRRRGRRCRQRLRHRHEERHDSCLPGHHPALDADRSRYERSHPTSATLSWTASTDNVGVTGYRLFQGGTQVGTLDDDRAIGYTGLTCATTYTLGVAAVDAAGNVSGTATKSADDSRLPRHHATVHPTGLATSAVGQTSATLVVDGLDRQRRRHRLPAVPEAASQVGTPTTTSYALHRPHLRHDLHARRRRGRRRRQRLRQPPPTSVTTIGLPRHDATHPPRPGSRRAQSPQTSATLSWTASTDNVGVTGYRTFRGATQVGTPTTTSYSFTGLTCGTTYTLGVAAADAAGNVSSTATTSVDDLGLPRHDAAVDANWIGHERDRTDRRDPVVDGIERQRRRHRLPGLPQRQPGRHFNHDQLPLHNPCVRHELHARRRSCRFRRKCVRCSDPHCVLGRLLRPASDGERLRLAVGQRLDLRARRPGAPVPLARRCVPEGARRRCRRHRGGKLRRADDPLQRLPRECPGDHLRAGIDVLDAGGRRGCRRAESRGNL